MAGEDMAGEDMAGEDMAGEDMEGEDMAGEDMVRCRVAPGLVTRHAGTPPTGPHPTIA